MKTEAREVEKNLPCPLGMGPATIQRTANSCTVMVRLSLLFQVTFVLDVTHILTSLVELSGLLDKI